MVKFAWRAHRWIYQRTGGRIGARLLGIPVLLLTTTGRRTGRLRTTALTYLSDGGRLVIVASNGGRPRHSEWFLNLQAHPHASVQRGAATTAVRARVARGEERDRLWARVVAMYRGYAAYQRRTQREIPIVILELRPAAREDAAPGAFDDPNADGPAKDAGSYDCCAVTVTGGAVMPWYVDVTVIV